MRDWTGAFTATFAHARSAVIENHGPCESGAGATAVQTRARWRAASEPRRAFGVRRVHRRFGAHARSASHPEIMARAEHSTPSPAPRRENRLPRPGKLATSDSSRFRSLMREFFRGCRSLRAEQSTNENSGAQGLIFLEPYFQMQLAGPLSGLWFGKSRWPQRNQYDARIRKPRRAAALPDGGALAKTSQARSVLECASPLALWPQPRLANQRSHPQFHRPSSSAISCLWLFYSLVPTHVTESARQSGNIRYTVVRQAFKW